MDETLKQALYNQKVHAVAKPSETTRALISCFIYSKHGHEIYLHEIEGFQNNVGYFFHNKSYYLICSPIFTIINLPSTLTPCGKPFLAP